MHQGFMYYLSWHITPVIFIEIMHHLCYSSPLLVCTTLDTFHSHLIESWLTNTLSADCGISLTVSTCHNWPWAPHKPGHFGDTLNQSSDYNDLALLKVTQIFIPAYSFCIQHVDFKHWMLAYPFKTSHTLFLWDSQHYLLFHNVLAHWYTITE